MKFYCYTHGEEEDAYVVYSDGKFYLHFGCGETRLMQPDEIEKFLKKTIRCRKTSMGMVCKEIEIKKK